MNAEKVVDKILADAKAEAEKIINQAKAERAAKQARFDERLAVFWKETEELAHKAGEERKARILARTRMDLSKECLAARRAMLNEVFVRTGEKLRQMPDGEYRTLMGELMKKSVETGDEEIVLGRNETRIDMDLIKQINRELGSGFKDNLRLSNERGDFEAGFVLRRGKIQVNVSLDVLLAQARENLETNLARELFAGE